MLESPLARGGGSNIPKSAPQSPMFPGTGTGSKEPGEFTRMMESPLAPQGLAGQGAAAPPPRPKATGDATRAFQRQMQPEAPAAPAQQGPSEFTKMFQAAPAPTPEAAPKPVKRAAGRPPIPKKQTNWLLIVLVGLAAVLALSLVLYFIFK
jgi:hypothetical protein